MCSVSRKNEEIACHIPANLKVETLALVIFSNDKIFKPVILSATMLRRIWVVSRIQSKKGSHIVTMSESRKICCNASSEDAVRLWHDIIHYLVMSCHNTCICMYHAYGVCGRMKKYDTVYGLFKKHLEIILLLQNTQNTVQLHFYGVQLRNQVKLYYTHETNVAR